MPKPIFDRSLEETVKMDIRFWLEKNGHEQSDLAEYLGVSGATVSRMLSLGPRGQKITLQQMLAIYTFLGLKVSIQIGEAHHA